MARSTAAWSASVIPGTASRPPPLSSRCCRGCCTPAPGTGRASRGGRPCIASTNATASHLGRGVHRGPAGGRTMSAVLGSVPDFGVLPDELLEEAPVLGRHHRSTLHAVDRAQVVRQVAPLAVDL